MDEGWKDGGEYFEIRIGFSRSRKSSCEVPGPVVATSKDCSPQSGSRLWRGWRVFLIFQTEGAWQKVAVFGSASKRGFIFDTEVLMALNENIVCSNLNRRGVKNVKEKCKYENRAVERTRQCQCIFYFQYNSEFVSWILELVNRSLESQDLNAIKFIIGLSHVILTLIFTAI